MLKLGLGREAALAVGTVLAVGITGWVLWNDNRLMPAGVLRLSPSTLEFTAGLQGPMQVAPSEIRDMVDSMGTLVVRRKKGPPVLIHPARLDVPLASVATALSSWMSTADSNLGVAFQQETVRTQSRENVRVKIMWWCAAIAAVCTVLAKVLPMIFSQ
jgi:hypothetical protein